MFTATQRGKGVGTYQTDYGGENTFICLWGLAIILLNRLYLMARM